MEAHILCPNAFPFHHSFCNIGQPSVSSEQVSLTYIDANILMPSSPSGKGKDFICLLMAQCSAGTQKVIQ